MKISINDIEVLIPSSLSEISLKQRINFQLVVENELDMIYKSILEIKDKAEKELNLFEFQLEKIYRTIAFFADCTTDALKELQDIDTIANIYLSTIHLLLEEEGEISNNQELKFLWNSEWWYIEVPELKNGSKMTFGEFIDSKQITQDMINLGKNRWECLLPLCAIFLRREGEEYREHFLHEDSDRIKLMEDLPLSIAIQVGFFLKNSLNSYINFFLSSSPQELRA